jgi:hypothetical protein
MHIEDARIVLDDLLDKEYADSMLIVYALRDSINTSSIKLQLSEIRLLQEKSLNQKTEMANLNKIISNNTKEVSDLNDVIEKQKKEIRKQKVLKVLGFTAAVVLPILVIIFTKH